MILGQRIRLRPIEKDDLPRFVRWLGDPEMRAYLDQHLPVGQVHEERWFERNLTLGDQQTWAVDAQHAEMAAGPWVHIGSCGFDYVDWRHRWGRVGILIGARDHWDKGYGTDVMQTLVAWGFYTLNLNRVWLRVYEDNARAIRCYEKVGFRLEGRLRQDNFYNGGYRDTLIMAVLRSDWEQAATASEIASIIRGEPSPPSVPPSPPAGPPRFSGRRAAMGGWQGG